MKSQIVLFMLLFVGASTLDAAILQREYAPGEQARLELVSVENGSDALEFQVFPAGNASVGTVYPMSTLQLGQDKKHPGIDIQGRDPVVVKCSKGSFAPVFIKDGVKASGVAPQGYEGPYTISMWLPYPHVPEAQKINIRYVVKHGVKGKIGVKIGTHGDYRLAAKEDVKFIH